MYNSFGILQIRNNSVILLIDKEIVDYYYNLIPKYIKKQRQKYKPHITVVRCFEYLDEKWKQYENKSVEFSYTSFIYEDSKYFYLKAWSNWISEKRKELGLKEYRFGDCYHISIGNQK